MKKMSLKNAHLNLIFQLTSLNLGDLGQIQSIQAISQTSKWGQSGIKDKNLHPITLRKLHKMKF